MEEKHIEQLKYPIGQFIRPEIVSQEMVKGWINELEELPSRLTNLVAPLSDAQMETPYRPGGWTVRQLVHHISDSHHNSYTRFKWALTEDKPVIKAYDEKGWANIFDTRTAPIKMSLDHLSAVHSKLVYLLKGLSAEDMQRSFIHPDNLVETTVEVNIGHYAWHGNHHYKHIEGLIIREGWS